jgi:hypothetical protein
VLLLQRVFHEGGRPAKPANVTPHHICQVPSYLTWSVDTATNECSKGNLLKVALLPRNTTIMHSTLVRVQSVFGFFTSAAFAVAAAIAFSVLLIPQAPSASLELKNVQVVKGRPHYYSTKREEYAHVKFDLDAGTYCDITQANAINNADPSIQT